MYTLPPPSEPSSEGRVGGGRLSTSDKIALRVGIGLGLPTLVIGIPAFRIAMRDLMSKAGSAGGGED
jgi:hypothetical protein